MERFGKYTLVRRLAVGGMAEIFLAEVAGAEGFQRTVALKRVLVDRFDEGDMRTMFLDEAKLAARLVHPNIVQVFDLGDMHGALFMTMEYIDGVDLSTLLRRLDKAGERLPLHAALPVLIAVLRALHYAHTRVVDGAPLEIVHRDVTPSNILISRDGWVKLADFGIAKSRARRTKTRTGFLKGKLPYMAPEQAGGDDVTAATDQFAAGLVAFEMFAGRRAYVSDDDPLLFQEVQTARVPRLDSVVPGFPPALAEVVAKATEKHPADRFADCGAFADALTTAAVALGPLMSEAQLAGIVDRHWVPAKVDALFMLGGVGDRADADVAMEPTPHRQPLQATPRTERTPAPSRSRSLRAAYALIALGGATILLLWPRLFSGESATKSSVAGAAPAPERAPVTPPPASLPAAVVPSAASVVAEAPRSSREPGRNTSAKSAVATGFLTLNSLPWAHVWVDGKKLPTATPIRQLELAAGKHSLRLVAGSGAEVLTDVVIRPGQTETKLIEFPPSP